MHQEDERLVMFINACRLDQRLRSLAGSICSSKPAIMATAHPVNQSDSFRNDSEQDLTALVFFVLFNYELIRLIQLVIIYIILYI